MAKIGMGIGIPSGAFIKGKGRSPVKPGAVKPKRGRKLPMEDDIIHTGTSGTDDTRPPRGREAGLRGMLIKHPQDGPSAKSRPSSNGHGKFKGMKSDKGFFGHMNPSKIKRSKIRGGCA